MIGADIICEALDELVGPTTPIGETNYDKKAKDDLNVLIDISDWCIEKLVKAAEYRHRLEWSMRTVGNDAFGELNYIKAQIEEAEDE